MRGSRGHAHTRRAARPAARFVAAGEWRGRPARTPRRTGSRASDPGHPGSRSGVRAQVRAGLRLARTTPGLSVYLGGGLAVWLLCRALVGHGLATSWLGSLAVGLLRLAGVSAVAALYFRRTGQLAAAGEDLRRLRLLLAERAGMPTDASRSRLRFHRLLGCLLRVRG